LFTREPTEEEKLLSREKDLAFEQEISLDQRIKKLIDRSYIDGRKNAQEHLEAIISHTFTFIRVIITIIICLIFIVVDARILAFVWKADLTTLAFTPEKLTIIKYGFLFLASQLVIFSQGFGFSSIVKLMERFSSKKNAKEVKEATKVEN